MFLVISLLTQSCLNLACNNEEDGGGDGGDSGDGVPGSNLVSLNNSEVSKFSIISSGSPLLLSWTIPYLFSGGDDGDDKGDDSGGGDGDGGDDDDDGGVLYQYN